MTFRGASVTPAEGKPAEVDGPPIPSLDGREVTVNLKNVSNAQRLTVHLLGVSDGTRTSNVSVQMGVLLGDTTGDGVVNSGDITQTRRQSGQVTVESNKRIDLSVDGVINSGDITLVRRHWGTALPTTVNKTQYEKDTPARKRLPAAQRGLGIRAEHPDLQR